jgi:hypothetical protein
MLQFAAVNEFHNATIFARSSPIRSA